MRTLLILILSTVLSGCGALSRIAFPQDFSEFREFSFEMQEALGFCVEDGSVIGATITHEGDDSHVLTLTTVLLLSGDEYERVVTPSRTMTQDEVEEMRTVFRRVYVEPFLPGVCFFAIVDPCVISSYQWDGSSFWGFLCNHPRVTTRSEASIQQFLESLRMESMP